MSATRRPAVGEAPPGVASESVAEPTSAGWIRRMVGYMAPHKRDALVALAASVGGTTIAAVAPLVQRVVVDDVVGHDDRALWPWLVALVAFGVVRFWLAYVRRYSGGKVALDVQHDLRTSIFAHLQRLDFARHDEMQTGQLVSRASTDVTIVQGLLQFLPIAIGNVLLFAISLVAMLWLSPLLTLLMLLVAPALLLTAFRLRDAIFPSSWDAQQKAGDVAGVVEESVTGVRVVKGFGQERQQLERLVDRAGQLYGSRQRLIRMQARLQSTMQVIPVFGQVGVLLFGGWLVIEGRITLGTFLAFSTYMLRLLPPVRMMAMILTVGQLARASAERIFDLLDSTPLVNERPDAADISVSRGEVTFDDVTFGYLRSEPVLDGFGLTVRPGETVALVGASGSGKSTVALLLPRFYDVLDGAVRIDGVDVRDVKLETLRRQIGVVFEDSFLFSDTVRANIAFARPDATDEEVHAAARAAEAHAFIEALPEGYDTVVGEQGLTLSGGQRQRVALARALLSNPRILLLDDATSSVDARVEEEIHGTLRRLLAGRTTLLIAHRRSTLDLADRIVVVERGRVLDSGTHEELWSRCGHYRTLLSGPGDDAEGTDAPVPDAGSVGDLGDGPAMTADGVTPSAWRVAEEVAGPAVGGGAGAVAAPAGGRKAGLGPGIGGGAGTGLGGGGFGGVGAILTPTPELMERVAALPPADARPAVDVAAESRPDPDFRFLRFLRPYRGGLVLGLTLVSLDAVATLTARPSCGAASTAASCTARSARCSRSRSPISPSRSSTG